MILPFDRARLRERNALDDAEAWAEAARCTPAERVESCLELSEFILDLSRAAGTAQHPDDHSDLAEKSRLFAEPLRILAARR